MSKQALLLVFVIILYPQTTLITQAANKQAANKQAAGKEAPRKLRPLSQPQEPIFDASYLPKRSNFELNIKYSQIVYPENPDQILHGDTKVVDLRAGDNRNLLRGYVTEEEKTSIIETREYGVKPRFVVNLRKLEAKYAPDLAHMMYAEIAAAKRRAAGQVERAEPEMEKELHAQKPKLDSIPVPLHKASTSAKPLEAELEKSRQNEKQNEEQPLKQFEAALAQAHGKGPALGPGPGSGLGPGQGAGFGHGLGSGLGSGAVPVLPGQGLGNDPALKMPQLPASALKMPELPTAATNKTTFPSTAVNGKLNPTPAENELQGELRAAKGKAAVSASDLTAEMLRARKQAQDAVKNAQPVMDTILTYLRRMPAASIPSGNQTPAPEENDTVSVLKWDEWHARFANLAGNPILSAVNKAGNPSGADTIEITVKNNHSITARLTSPGNAAFDQAILQAYQSLDGNPDLEFPAGSRRKELSFSIDNKHAGGVPTAVKSQTSIGDQEMLRKSR